jgi:hypothetical protein
MTDKKTAENAPSSSIEEAPATTEPLAFRVKTLRTLLRTSIAAGTCGGATGRNPNCLSPTIREQ